MPRHLPAALLIRHALIPAPAAAFAMALACAMPAAGGTAGGYTYVSPAAGAALVLPRNDVVLRSAGAVDMPSLAPARLHVQGSSSGAHAGSLALSDDGRTLVFTPERPFAPGERVRVRADEGLARTAGLPLGATAFEFSVAPELAPARRAAALAAAGDGEASRHDLTGAAAVSAPSWPVASVALASAPEDGFVFTTPNVQGKGGVLLALDDSGQPIFYRHVPAKTDGLTLQPNGRLSYYDDTLQGFYLLDENYTIVDSIRAGNGYTADFHDLQILPDGHALVLIYDPEPVPMDTVVAGGDPNAIVTGLVVQELDAARRVVFQWRSWDHLAITDAIPCLVNLKTRFVDDVHGNSVARDLDGNLLVSLRHFNEVVKIDRETGAILWRLGRNAARNDFQFTNDTRGFAGQHDVRRLANGHLTLFDNGNCLSPQYSRALEYALDEQQHTATLVWEYRHTPDLFTLGVGNVQRRANGATLVHWGLTDVVTDLHPDGTPALELNLPVGTSPYRAFRFHWRSHLLVTNVDSLVFARTAIGDSARLLLNVWNLSTRPVVITSFDCTDVAFLVRQKLPLTIKPRLSATFPVTYLPNHPRTSRATLYVSAANDTERVAAPVLLVGTGKGTADVGPAAGPDFALGAVWPQPARGAVRVRFSLGRAAAVRLTVADVQGRRVATLVDDTLPAGAHERRWNAGDAPAGVYYVRMEGPAGEARRALVLLR